MVIITSHSPGLCVDQQSGSPPPYLLSPGSLNVLHLGQSQGSNKTHAQNWVNVVQTHLETNQDKQLSPLQDFDLCPVNVFCLLYVTAGKPEFCASHFLLLPPTLMMVIYVNYITTWNILLLALGSNFS